MDGHGFDTLAKTLASGLGRRHLVRGAAGGVLGAVLAPLLPGLAAEADAKRRDGKARGRGKRRARLGAEDAGGVDGCAEFCRDQPGARHVQCLQACRSCRSPGCVIQDIQTRHFTCCCGQPSLCCGDACVMEQCSIVFEPPGHREPDPPPPQASPEPCAVYCAGEPGDRQAECLAVCRACPDLRCIFPVDGGFTCCCPCLSAIGSPGGCRLP
jgi:hypothetical protein